MTGRTSSIRTGEWALAVVVAAGVAVAAALGLGALSRPSDLDGRLAAVRQDAEDAQQLFRRRSASAAPADAICRGAPATGAAKLKDALAAASSASGVTKPLIEVRPGPPGPSENKLSGLTLHIEAEGGYEAALDLLARLSDIRPVVFVDTVDIRSSNSFVTIAISGRAYCSVSD